MMQDCTAVVVAAGTAQRMRGIDKALAALDGMPVILRTVRALAACREIGGIVLVTRQDLLRRVEKLCAGEEKLLAVVPGGTSRTASVQAGLARVTTPLVAIHDGARPLVTVPVIEAALAAARTHGAAAPAIPLRDTVKVAAAGFVCSTPDRSTLFAVQTPQVFYTRQILQALETAVARGIPLTDDCSAAEAAGMPVCLTEGDEENLKITTPMDLEIARQICKRRKRQ